MNLVWSDSFSLVSGSLGYACHESGERQLVCWATRDISPFLSDMLTMPNMGCTT